MDIIAVSSETWGLIKEHAGHHTSIDLLDGNLDLTEESNDAESAQIVCFDCDGDRIMEVDAP